MPTLNINDTVRVRLNDTGREIIRKHHDDLFRGSSRPIEYRPKEEDQEGWSYWQMWKLFQVFGPHISMGFEVPFETTIEIPPFRPSALKEEK